MSWSTVVRSYLAALKMLFRTSSRQLNLRRVTGGTIRHKDAKKILLAKQRNKGRPPYDRLYIARSARETAMGRYVICGPACSKKCSGPHSVSSDARTFSGIGALNHTHFIIGVDDQWMLALVTEEDLFDEGLKMAAAE